MIFQTHWENVVFCHFSAFEHVMYKNIKEKTGISLFRLINGQLFNIDQLTLKYLIFVYGSNCVNCLVTQFVSLLSYILKGVLMLNVFTPNVIILSRMNQVGREVLSYDLF